MTQIETLLNEAQLAIAAYANLSQGETDRPENREPLSNAGIPGSLLEDFANRYPTVVMQYDDATDPLGMHTGLSATVFADSGGNLTLAIRGTNESSDLLPTGADIAISGAGYDQIVALTNWWLRASVRQGTMVKQYRLASYPEDAIPPGAVLLHGGSQNVVLEDGPQVPATGQLADALDADANHRVDVTGHSLGGHLSMAFSTIFPGVTGAVTGFNAPGFIDSATNRAFFAKLGGSIPTGASIVNVAADEALIDKTPFNWIAGMNSRPGLAVDVAIENQSSSDEPAPFGARNHSIVTLADSFAVYSLLADLSPSVAPESYRLILGQASRTSEAGYERIVDRLEALFVGETKPLQSGNSKRNELYSAIYALKATPSYVSRLGTLEILPTPDSAQDLLAGAALGNEHGIAYRYALVSLSPFVAVDLEQTLYLRYRAGGANAGELDPFDSAANPKGLTGKYLRDRADFLERSMYISGLDRDEFYQVRGETHDSFPNAPDDRGHAYQLEGKSFEDLGSGTVIFPGPANSLQHFVFGTSGADGLNGAGREDHLYGGAGGDVLVGNQGDDYIEGGMGDDVYKFSTDDGQDEVLDADGKGILVRNGAPLALGVKNQDGSWGFRGATFTQNGSDLEVGFSGSDKITIRNFDLAAAQANGYLGVRLVDAPSVPANPVTTYPGNQNAGNPDDTLSGSAADVVEHFVAGDGDDTVYGDGAGSGTSSAGGSDWIEAGMGTDIALGGGGKDWIEGGVDADILTGNAGDDMLWAETSANGTVTLEQAVAAGETALSLAAQGDLVSGDQGNDIVIGSDRNDLLLGGADDNILVGGGGDDVIYTAKNLVSASLGWTATPSRVESGGTVTFSVALSGAAIAESAADGPSIAYGAAGNDWIFGGAGDDYLDGGAGNDVLSGGAGNDVLAGGGGSNSLIGGADRDTYILTAGSNNEIFDADADSVIVGTNYTRSKLTVLPGSMKLDFADEGTIDFKSFDHNDPNSTAAFQAFAFDDGTTLSWQDVLDIGFMINGTEEDDRGQDAAHPMLAGTAFRDNIFGFGGNDILAGLQGDDVLEGGAGADQLQGNDGNDTLAGGEGNDALFGQAGDDVLDGGEGRDWLLGGAGDDIYAYGAGDTADDRVGATTVAFEAGINLGDVVLHRQVVNSLPVYWVALRNDLTPYEQANLPFPEHALGLTLASDDQLASFSFADGTVLDHAALLRETWVDPAFVAGGALDDALEGYAGSDLLRGDAGNDLLSGFGGDDRLEGGAGDDVLAGGSGNDTLAGGDGSDLYLYARGDGDDAINDGGDAAATDILRFSDVASTEVTLARQASGDLVATVSGGGSVTISGYYNNPANKIERIEFSDGVFLDGAQLDALTVPPMTGTPGDDALVGTAYADTIQGLAGNDTLDGAGGNDLLDGGSGADTYVLRANGGADRIVEDGAEPSIIQLTPGWGFADTSTARSGDDLVLSLKGGAANMTLSGYYQGNTNWLVRTDSGEQKTIPGLEDYLGGLGVRPPSTLPELQQAFLDNAARNYATYLAGWGATGGVIVNEQAPSDAATILVTVPAGETAPSPQTNPPSAYLNFAHVVAGASANSLDFRFSLNVIADAGAGNDLINNSGQGFTYTDLDTGKLKTIGSILYGGAGDDQIAGSWSDDVIVGGPGNDTLYGALGNDTYVVFAADTGAKLVDEVTSVAISGYAVGARDSKDTLLFPDLSFTNATLDYASLPSPSGAVGLAITWGAGNKVAVVLPNPADPALAQYPGESYGVETIAFADGRSISLADALALQPSVIAPPGTPIFPLPFNGTPGNDVMSFSVAATGVLVNALGGDDRVNGSRADDSIDGGAGNDQLFGWYGNDTLNGGSGDDQLSGEYGNDTLIGGLGADTLMGGQGSDTYVFNRGDGRDVLSEFSPSYDFFTDAVRFGSGIAPADVGVTDDGLNLYLVLLGTADRIKIEGEVPGAAPNTGIEKVQFADGTVWGTSDLYSRIALLPPTEFADVLAGTSQGDIVNGLGGDDQMLGRGGDDVLFGGDGNDYVEGDEGNDILRGDAGNDDIEDWGAGNNFLDGGAGDDYLYEEGHSFVIGGAGADWIEHNGDGGVIAFNRGDGADTVRVNGSLTLSLGGGIVTGDLTLAADGADYVLSMGGGDSIRLTGLDAQASAVTVQIVGDDVRSYGLFDLGTPLSASTNQLLGGDIAYAYAQGNLASALDDNAIRAVTTASDFGNAPQTAVRAPVPPVTGSGVIGGSALNDTVTGGSGADWLAGGAGNDTLAGGAGNDLLFGGPGADTYVYNLGDGTDTIFDPSGTGGSNTLVFGDGISSGSLSLGLGSLLVRVGTTGALHLESFDPANPFGPHDIDQFVFADGTALGYEALLDRGIDLYGTDGADSITGTATTDRIYGGRGADVLAGGLGSDIYFFNTGEGADIVVETSDPASTDILRFGAQIDAGTLVMRQSGDDLAIRLSSPGDSVTLRAWYASAERPIEQVQFADGASWSAAELESRVTVEPVNSVPLLAHPVTDQLASEDSAFTFTLAADTFSDPDAGDTLTYDAGKADGSALPAWLSFDAASRTFSGTPANADVGSYELELTATDAAGASASDVFNLSVANVNDAPTVPVPLGDQSVVAGSLFDFTVPGGTFADVDAGDTLALSANLFGGTGLPAWLSFDSASATFSGTPQTADIGVSQIAVNATDRSGASAVSGFGLTVRAAEGSRVTGTSGDDVLVGNSGGETLIARDGNDALFGEAGDDILRGGAGNDVVQGGAGDDVLRAGTGESLLDGGSGNDLIFGGSGSAFISGGAGNDSIRLNSGHDVIAFGRGDGTDTLYGGVEGGSTLSFGGGIRYSDLILTRAGSDLLVGAGGDDKIVLKDWYAGSRSVLNLQLILDATEDFDASSSDPLYNRRVQTFDFAGLASAFDQAYAQTPGLTSWAVTNALLQFHLSGVDDAAIGGDLAYWHGRNRTLAGISLQAAQAAIGAAGFGSEAQTLHPFSGLQEGFVKLA